jgi:putative transcriptional regulator
MTKKRDIGREILAGLRAVKRGKGRRIEVKLPENVQAIRERMGLSQSAFAALLGVSTRTLQEWEQGRKHPSGAARTLLKIAGSNPQALLAVADD